MSKIDIYNPPRKYSVIYADPPWSYTQKGRGAAANHYGTMSLPEICDLPVKNLKTDDALLFMWATFPNMAEALEVFRAWGFDYKTAAFVWVKKNRSSGSNFWGMGAYTRANAEPCLLGVSKGTRAHEQIKAHNVHQIIEAEIGRHSAKPPETRERIAQLLGSSGERLELFARETAPGWDCWGDEV